MLNGAVSLGVLCFSFFGAFGFFTLGVAFRLGLVSFRRGELDDVVARPLRVVLRPESSSFADLGVGGENKACSFYHPLAIGSETTGDIAYLHAVVRPVLVILRWWTISLLYLDQHGYMCEDVGTLTYCIPSPSPRGWLSACDACEGIPSCATEPGEPYPVSPNE